MPDIAHLAAHFVSIEVGLCNSGDCCKAGEGATGNAVSAAG